ncbi:death-associated inhibitor of apoptosis 2-like [Saccostrea echinata]|uniref:death-associated inhibitor of apoptosis 2-like n=1 Tax=Saccostrea echinata TaxID=191078 RepID=UPI002A83B92F|nr:death-associated inhibitor of apoptosis 2-like [Saccostrea echinata]
MTSTLDGIPNLIETDSAANFAWGNTSSLECEPSDSWEADSNANFAWGYPDSSSSKKKSEEYVTIQMPVKNIPPPPLPKKEVSVWKYPEYVNFSERYASFGDWPKYLKGPNKKDLARSGFIYTKIGDRVTCFSCGMTLKNWEPLDDAYKEHLRWSKNCTYARMVTDGKYDDWRKRSYNVRQ